MRYAYSNADVKPNGNGNSNAYGSGHSYTYCSGYGNAYCDRSLHTQLHIHIGNRNARAGSQRQWKPLR